MDKKALEQFLSEWSDDQVITPEHWEALPRADKADAFSRFLARKAGVRYSCEVIEETGNFTTKFFYDGTKTEFAPRRGSWVEGYRLPNAGKTSATITRLVRKYDGKLGICFGEYRPRQVREYALLGPREWYYTRNYYELWIGGCS